MNTEIATTDLPDWMQERFVARGVEDGVEWVTLTAPHGGAINGYVRIPEGNPWHGLDYSRIHGVKVNGGLTYAEGDWIGFDTLHSGDVWPETDPILADVPWARVWTPDLVADEARSLARQVAAAPETERPPVYSEYVSAARDADLAAWDDKKGYLDRDDFLAGFEAGYRAAINEASE